jgi:hypothetical protein
MSFSDMFVSPAWEPWQRMLGSRRYRSAASLGESLDHGEYGARSVSRPGAEARGGTNPHDAAIPERDGKRDAFTKPDTEPGMKRP